MGGHNKASGGQGCTWCWGVDVQTFSPCTPHLQPIPCQHSANKPGRGHMAVWFVWVWISWVQANPINFFLGGDTQSNPIDVR